MKPWLSGPGHDIANCLGEWLKLRDGRVQMTHSYHLVSFADHQVMLPLSHSRHSSWMAGTSPSLLSFQVLLESLAIAPVSQAMNLGAGFSLTSTDSWAHFSPFLVLAPFHLQLQTLYLRHLFWTSTHSL